MSTVAIVQARMGSTRLPGKVMMDLAGQPVLVRVISRLSRAKTIDKIVVATTVVPPDAPIESLCARQGWACFRGSENDVLDRYYRAAGEHKAQVVVRVTSDCPLIDPEVVDLVVREFLGAQSDLDYAANVAFPRGLDTEVMRFDALERAWQEDADPAWREHATMYIARHPEKFRHRMIRCPQDLSGMRWTVDTPEDLAFARKIYDYFGDDGFSWKQVLEVLRLNPQWADINRHIRQKEV